MKKPKVKCEGCLKKMRRKHICWYKGKYLCGSCRMQLIHQQQSAMEIGKIQSLDKALSKIYKVRTYTSNKGKPLLYCLISVPTILMGKKVKLSLMLESEEKENEVPLPKLHNEKKKRCYKNSKS